MMPQRIFLVLVTLGTLALASCNQTRVTGTGNAPPSSPGASKGPPAHAPAHGYRRKHQYTYYPSSQVYYSVDRGTWFWIEGGGWKVGAQLPSTVILDTTDAISLSLDSDNPADQHGGIAAEHPARSSQAKGKAKKSG